MTLKTMVRHSKLQLQVLNLYKQFMRVTENRPGMKEHVRQEFKKYAVLKKTDVMRIEHVYRRAERQLQQLKKPEVRGIGVFEKEDK